MEEKPIEETPPTISVSKKRSMSNIWKIVTLILVVLILLGGGYFIAVQKNSHVYAPTITPQATVSPKESPAEKVTMSTYSNTQYGYSFNYPSDWEVLGNPTDATIGLAPRGNKDAAIRVDVSNMVFDDRGVIPFADYAKVAAKNEIQNYTKLSTIKEVTTTSGVVGYETTWEVASLPGAGGGTSVSDPMTYFPLSSKYGSGLLSKRFQISIENNSSKFIEIYNSIIPTLTFN